jgi:hypothetical protein
MYANRNSGSSKLFRLPGPTYTPYHMMVESRPLSPASPHQDASSTTATVPRRSIANRHVKRCLDMYANRNS